MNARRVYQVVSGDARHRTRCAVGRTTTSRYLKRAGRGHLSDCQGRGRARRLTQGNAPSRGLFARRGRSPHPRLAGRATPYPPRVSVACNDCRNHVGNHSDPPSIRTSDTHPVRVARPGRRPGVFRRIIEYEGTDSPRRRELAFSSMTPPPPTPMHSWGKVLRSARRARSQLYWGLKSRFASVPDTS
jgi:hypothetical protein